MEVDIRAEAAKARLRARDILGPGIDGSPGSQLYPEILRLVDALEEAINLIEKNVLNLYDGSGVYVRYSEFEAFAEKWGLDAEH